MPDAEQTKQELQALYGEITTLASRTTSTSDASFTSWHSRTQSALSRALGASHHITTAFVTLKWRPTAYSSANAQAAYAGAFAGAVKKSQGYLDAAIAEVDHLAEEAGVIDASGVDPELWEHIAGDVERGDWTRVASQTAIFTEDRIRRWTGHAPELVGEKLMSAAFGDSGDYRLGLTAGEKQGWHRLAMGVSMALRNADAHRIQQRHDHRLYAMGVVGVSSLLLTQLRYEHGNRFHDTSPVPTDTVTPPGQTEPDV